jgi:hypothetical protein
MADWTNDMTSLEADCITRNTRLSDDLQYLLFGMNIEWPNHRNIGMENNTACYLKSQSIRLADLLAVECN